MSIKQLRLDIDACINSTRLIRQSREVALCHTNLQRAFMWLGESLKAAGSTTPYTESENPANTTIEPQAEQSNTDLSGRWDEIEYTQTARVKDFRARLQEIISNFELFDATNETSSTEEWHCRKQSYLALKESKMWLGWELNRIKKEKDGIAPANKPIDIPL